MSETPVWRELLLQIISDLQERRRIAKHVEINMATLVRWAHNQTDPRQENLLALLDALPNQREQFMESMRQEFPHYFQYDPNIIPSLEIPAVFYHRALVSYKENTPAGRLSELPTMVVQQIAAQLGMQPREGVVAIVKCVTPASPENRVLSLHRIARQGIPPQPPLLEGLSTFYGVESPVGRAVSERRPMIVQSASERKWQYPQYIPEYPNIESELAYPITLRDGVAGCLYIASTHTNYFNKAREESAQRYAILLLLAFGDLFYNNIILNLMPPPEMQVSELVKFQEYVKYVMETHPDLTRPKAEPIACRLIEDKLFDLLK